MQNKMPVFKENDFLCVYKEKVFNNFAPCFDNGLYSLACCKGNMRHGGMRASLCRKLSKDTTVWVLSIAGLEISKNQNNTSIKKYSPGEAIYLAKISDCMSWQEYGEKYELREENMPIDKTHRKDAIYFYDGNKLQRRENPNHDIGAMASDCATGLKNCHTVKQILLSDEFYVFDAGLEIKEYNLKCRHKFNGLTIKALSDKLINEPQKSINAYMRNPFIIESKVIGGC